MATPTRQQALSLYERQRDLAALAVRATRKLIEARAPIVRIAATTAAYQLASATAASQSVTEFAAGRTALTSAQAFMGVSSFGFPISEPIVATIDRVLPAPLEALPDAWWTDASAFIDEVSQLIASEVQDAGRSAAQVEFSTRPEWTNYVRMLTPPSCGRCAILAGRIYRDLEAFERHPQCDCVMVPVESWQDAHDEGYVSSAQDAFDAGQITGLSEADTQAIKDGADIAAVVNAHRGMRTVGAFGRQVKTTSVGTTRRAAWRKANPTRLMRLRPEAIYQIAEDHADAIRLLRIYGYLT